MPVEEWPKMRKFPKVLYRVYGNRIQTLRQLILQLLGTSFSNADCECEHFNYCLKCDPPGYLLRDEDHAEYWKLLECSYGVVSNPASLPHSFTLENRWTQQQIIERVIELHFRQATRPLNVICFGYGQLQPNHAEMASTSTAYGLESTSSNSAIKILNSEAWVVLLSRVGDMFMLHLLLYTSIFYPLPNKSYVQIVGVPISSLVSSSQPHELLRIGPLCHDATETCKTSGFQTKSSFSHLRNQSQLEVLSHKPVQLIHGAEVSSILPVTGCTGSDLKFRNSIRNRSSKNGDRSYKDAHKRSFSSDHWIGSSKKKKANIDESRLNPKNCLHNSSTDYRSEDSYKNGHSSKSAVPDFHHGLHMLSGMNNLHGWSKEHPEMGSVELPESYFCLSKRSPVHFWSHSKSESTEHPFLHLKSSANTDSAHECLNLKNIPLEVCHSLSCNIPKKGGRLKKRSRIFSWQRRKIYKAQERSLAIESMEQYSRLKDKTSEDYMRNKQLQSPPYFFNSLDNYGSVNLLGVGSQYSSRQLLEEKTTRTTSGEAYVSDQKFVLNSNMLSLDVKEDGDQELDMVQHTKGSKLSIFEDKLVRQAGNYDSICHSSSCHCEGTRTVDASLNICTIHDCVCNSRRKSLYPEEDNQKHLIAGRKCIFGACDMRVQKDDNSSEAIYKLQTQSHQKSQQIHPLDNSHVSEKLYSQLIANPANRGVLNENAMPKYQCMLLSNQRKFFCSCVCWLMVHMRHMDTTNILINRRSLFYNSKFTHHGGFPPNHILNVAKPRISGAKQLLAIIFGLPNSNSCLNESITDGFGLSESLCQNWGLLSTLKSIIRNSQRCRYAKLLTRHCSVQIKKPSETYTMPSSEITGSFSFMEGHDIHEKETLSILNGTFHKANNPITIHLASSPQGVSRNHDQHAENGCLIHYEHLNEQCIFKDTIISGSQHATPPDSRDYEMHTSSSFLKPSDMYRLRVKRKHEGHCNSGANDYTDECDSKQLNTFLHRSNELSNGSQNGLVNSYCTHKEVVSFIWAVCRSVIPESLLGSKKNWRALRSNIGKFVRLRRFERFTLQQCLYKLKTSHLSWLNEASLSCECWASLNSLNGICPKFLCDSLEEKKQHAYHHCRDTNKGGTGAHNLFLHENLLANWIFWLFSGMIVPLIRAHFYVTETQNGKQNVYYYRKNIWAKILNGAVKDLTRSNYKQLNAESLASILQKRSLGFSRVRILPKEKGVRPIANFGARSTTWLQLTRDSGQTVKKRKTNRLANNFPISDVNNREKCCKKPGLIEKNDQVSLHSLPSNGNKDAGIEDKCEYFSFDRLISDKSNRESERLCGSDSKVKLSFRSINSLLCDVHHCLKFEQEKFPEALGCSVFDYNDIYVKLKPFVLSMKDSCMGLPKLYIAVCDVAQAFDTVDQDKLLDVMQNILQKEEYFIQRYVRVSCTEKSVKVSYERDSVEEKGVNFAKFSMNHSAKHSQGILIDQAFFTSIKRDKLLGLMYEHVKRNILRLGSHFYIQKVGIPQGSVLSSLLCSFYYGDLDRNEIFPLLNYTHKKQTIVSSKTALENCVVDRKLSCGKVCNKGYLVGDATTTLFEEMDKISDVTARQSKIIRVECEGLNAELNACASDVPINSYSKYINEHKVGNLESVQPHSILLRLIDDTLFISTSKEKAYCFIASMHRGFKDYNSYANKAKTSLNFKMDLEGKTLSKNVYKGMDGSCFLRWSGLLINCYTLEIQADYTRYCASHIRSTLTVWRKESPGYHLLVKLCQFMRPKCHPIFYDSDLNSPTTVRLNVYQAFLLCAMKFHVYACSVPAVGAFSPQYAFRAIMKSTRYMYKLVKKRMHNIGVKSSIRPIFSLQQKEIEWLGLYAYRKALQRKQSRYRQLISFLEVKLHSLKYQDLVESIELHFAVDDCHSSMFWQIKY
ncbi:telomerase reverse transcriptase isoform X5 [Cryptomeria japonica]|uniref:telomerase reverse transcriptase isoform X5 n=1 Tax=Cryptomeria japonica TaxID=3369 RepID=UPI0027DA0361|nr:telomerase reverse transcriptase isoform X5 [Cryptomeria japonica]